MNAKGFVALFGPMAGFVLFLGLMATMLGGFWKPDRPAAIVAVTGAKSVSEEELAQLATGDIVCFAQGEHRGQLRQVLWAKGDSILLDDFACSRSALSGLVGTITKRADSAWPLAAAKKIRQWQ